MPSSTDFTPVLSAKYLFCFLCLNFSDKSNFFVTYYTFFWHKQQQFSSDIFCYIHLSIIRKNCCIFLFWYLFSFINFHIKKKARLHIGFFPYIQSGSLMPSFISGNKSINQTFHYSSASISALISSSQSAIACSVIVSSFCNSQPSC